jgi:hypothetical protein
MVYLQYPAVVVRQTCDFVVAPLAALEYAGCAAGEGSLGVDLLLPDRAYPGGRNRNRP